MAAKYPRVITQVRGLGLMIGIELAEGNSRLCRLGQIARHSVYSSIARGGPAGHSVRGEDHAGSCPP